MDSKNASAIQTVKAMLEAQLVERDTERALSFLTEDIVWIGSGNGEEVQNLAESRRYFQAEAAANPAPYQIAYLDEMERSITSQCAMAVLHAVITGGGVSMQCRISAITKGTEGREKICQLHMSVPDANQQEGEFFPFSLAERYTNEVYHEFLSNEINAGVIGGYYDGDYALYTMNEQFLQMLGYSSQESFLDDTQGNLSSSIHPDDLAVIQRTVREQVAETGKFQVLYRIRKQDGTYIWVEDQGKLVPTEDGRNAVVSICNDVTQRQEWIETLKNQADQLALYRISQNAGAYRISMEGDMPLLYGNDRLYQMLGYEGMREKLQSGCLPFVHPDDRGMIKKKVTEALQSNNRNLEWVMRIFAGDGQLRYMQVVGSLSETKDGLVMEGIEIDVTEQKRTELALFERNAMFEALLENSNLSMWTYDVKTHVATLISSKKHTRPLSPSGTENYPESIIATGFIKESSVEPMRNLLKQVDSGVKTASADIWYMPKDDESWCEKVTYVNIFGENGEILRTVGIAEDVTEQRVAQQQYEEELNYQQTLQSDVLLTKVRANLTKNVLESYEGAESVRICQPSLPYDAAIESLEKVGYRAEDRKRIRSLLKADKIIGEFERGKHLFSFDYRRRTNTGTVIWANISVKTYRDMQSGDIKSFLYTANIDRKRTNTEILRAVASTEHDYIMLANLGTGEYALFSDRQDAYILPPESGNDFAEMCARVNRTGIAKEDSERAVRDMTPSVIRENLRLNPVFSAAYRTKTENGVLNYKKIQYYWLNEDLNQLILTRSDITDLTREQQQQQQALLRDALIQAEQANHAKTDFLSKMSHEIRTPMNAIIGMNALAAQNIHDVETASDCIAKVGISSRYLLTLINDILDMSRIESGKMTLRNEEIPFEEFIHGVNTVIYAQASANKLSYDSIITGYVADSYVGDAMKLQQILVNLLGNAVKFTPPGGKIQLIISQERVEHEIAHMKFIVNDTGVGISEEFQKIMFTPFEQEENGTTTPYGGTGLGLAITKNLVSLMGGSITVNSIVGVGTEFVVNLPLRVSEEQIVSRQSSSVHLETMSALVVDDEILICEQAKSILCEIGMKAEWVTSGLQAVERVKEKWSRKMGYDLILVDWKMPDMDGIETARQIRRIVGPDVTIIIITAYEWAEIEKEAKAAGVNLLITKPLFKSSLVSTFERILSPKAKQTDITMQKEYDFSGKCALLVEDHLLNVEVAKRLLQAKGMKVEVAENGLAAIEAFAAAPLGHFDVILMDIRMPVMDGLTATRSIRQLKKKTAKTIPIIAMSANAFDEDVEKSRAAGMNMHLAKPIEPELLYQTLDHLLRNNV